ncbi:MAG TPA: glucose-6-phosphate dehydrogenase (NADP(+)), partial [Armatimonadetes bacterium]|nr:glucose-6-phosphate dehydrogenase (NADP(+)) [Armatimonadota bacterium]
MDVVKDAEGQNLPDVRVRATTSSEDMPQGLACLIEEELEPCSLVIFGASGHLTSGKLVPALFSLYVYGVLPSRTLILGCARSQLDDESFRSKMEEAVSSLPHYHPDKWAEFREMLFYLPIDYGSLDSLKALETKLSLLEGLEHRRGRLLYLAIPPSLYSICIEAIGRSGLARPEAQQVLWTRIVIEKPFGRDLKSAVELDGLVHKFFQEEQIFRIDHYLAKETVQNILMFRFANAIFEPIWNRQYIDHVSIFAMESEGVGERAGYYEEAGVFRDMFQNHMMQLLALTAMEPPAKFDPDRVRDEKVKVYRELRPFPLKELGSHLVLGQYTRGLVEGREVPGYREEPGV